MKILLNNYMSALYAIASENNSVTKITDAMHILSDILETNPDFKKIIMSPVFSSTLKNKIINTIFLKIAPDYFIKFLFVLFKNNRAQLLPALNRAWDELIKLKSNIFNAVITLAREPDKEEIQFIEAFLKKNVSNSSFEIEFKTDPVLIGGFTIMLKNKIYDNSVKGHITQIKKLLN